MNRFMGKINETFRENRIYYMIVLLLFCIGIVIGIYTVKYMNQSDRNELGNYFTSFANGVGERQTDYGTLLFDVLKKNILLIIPIVLLSLTFFGVPFILAFDLLKGFSLGYSFAFLVTTFEGKGMGLALAAIIPQNLVYIPCFIALSAISVSISIAKFKEKFSKHPVSIGFNSKSIINSLIVLFAILMIGVVIETYVCPSIIRFVVTKFYT